MSDDPLITTKQAATELGVHPETLKRWIRTGLITGCMFGNRYMLRQSDVDHVKTHGTHQPVTQQPEA